MSKNIPQAQLKKNAALHALSFITEEISYLGLGTGSTVNCLLEYLAQPEYKKILKNISAIVSSSDQTTALIKKLNLNIPIENLNNIGTVDLYLDGADEVNPFNQLIKGGGGALTREKILAAASKTFICLVDETKYVQTLGKFPLPIEVIPMARSYVARELIQLGGQPFYRENFTTDNQQIILDVRNLDCSKPIALEQAINQITGVVTCGLFAARPADKVIIASQTGIIENTK